MSGAGAMMEMIADRENLHFGGVLSPRGTKEKQAFQRVTSPFVDESTGQSVTISSLLEQRATMTTWVHFLIYSGGGGA
jgi:hypothetical protein